MERETGFEPATTSLENWDSAIELLPHQRTKIIHGFSLNPRMPNPSKPRIRAVESRQKGFSTINFQLFHCSLLFAWRKEKMVGRIGFEPMKAVGRQIYSLLPSTTRAPAHR